MGLIRVVFFPFFPYPFLKKVSSHFREQAAAGDEEFKNLVALA